MNDHWLLPPDFIEEEKQIALIGLETIYKQFPDPIDQLIIACCFELDYPQLFVSQILDRSEGAVSQRVKKIKTILMRTHRSYIKQD